MRPNSARTCIALLLVAPLLAGCLERGQPTMVSAGGDDDDAFCRANNVKAGSSEYIACRKDRDFSATMPTRAPTARSAISANTC